MASPDDPKQIHRDVAAVGDPGGGFTTVRGSLRISRRFYAAPPGQRRVRRATDIVAAATSLLVLTGLILAQPPGPFERSLLRFLEAFPAWLGPVWAILVSLLTLWAIGMLVAPLASRRSRITLEALAAIVATVALTALAARFAMGSWAGAEATSGWSESLRFPAERIAMTAAVIGVANAHVVRPYAVLGRWLLVLGSGAAVMQGTTTIGGTAAALLIGVAAGAGVRLALGTSAGRPSMADIAAALDRLDVDAHALAPAEDQVAGVFLIDAKDASGASLKIKVYGRDAYDNQLLAKLWRTLWYRDGGPTVGFYRAFRAEREALLTLLARNAGVPTAEVVTAAVTPDQDALLVLRVRGVPLASLAAGEVGDALLAEAWTALDRLGRGHLAHGNVNPWSVHVADGAIWLSDLGGGTVAAGEDDRLTDRAQLLTTTATAVGSERALAAALAAIGPDGVAALLPYIQQAAFGQPLRRAAKAAGVDADELRKEAALAAGSPEPELVRLRRVTWRTVLQLGLLVFAGAAVLSFVGGVNFGDLQEDLQGASWGWLVAAGLVAQLPRVTQAISTLGSTPVRMPFGPVYVMQLATSYMNLALPSSLARMAINVRFFQRQGVAPAVAITSGAIDSLTGTVVQVAMLVLLLIFSSATLSLDLSAPDAPDIQRLAYLLIALLALVIAGLWLLPYGKRLRATMRERLETWWPQVRGTFSALRGSNKVIPLLLGNIGTEVLFAIALGLFARGLGFPISLPDLLVINMSVALFATFIPIPGGIGVVEGGLLVGLTSVGMPESTAFAAIVLYRVTTFYLPPIWGFFAMQWLQRNRYL